MEATIRVKGRDQVISGKTTKELFEVADSLGATRLNDSMNGVCVKLEGEWIWLR